uniref:Malate dehydrogenase n=1 Tax=Ditylenchus dipsaci TaxID=166011 RepID=A0A915CSA4_9BILA
MGIEAKRMHCLVDGDNAMGVITAIFCTDLAIKLARDHGIGWVVAAHSNHYGICAHYANKMAKQGFVVEVADRKGVSKISNAWGADSNGLSTTNPKSILNGGGLLPLGTVDEASAAYKGTGLSMMVDLFTGILAGKAWGKHVGKGRDLSTEANPVNPEQPVLVPGDPEEAHSGMCAKAGGIVYPTHIIEHLKTVAHNYKIPMFVFKEVNK